MIDSGSDSEPSADELDKDELNKIMPKSLMNKKKRGKNKKRKKKMQVDASNLHMCKHLFNKNDTINDDNNKSLN